MPHHPRPAWQVAGLPAGGGMAFAFLWVFLAFLAAPAQSRKAPYPPSERIRGITFHFEGVHSAARGSDIWPVTWGSDGNLYTAWGDGNGFSGPRKVSWGVARLEGSPAAWTGRDVCYGPPGSHQGKISGLIALGDTLYAWKNTQKGSYPGCPVVLCLSTDQGRSWRQTEIVFGTTGFIPVSFVNFGAGYAQARDGFVYTAGFSPDHPGHGIFLARVPRGKMTDRTAYSFYAGREPAGRIRWETGTADMQPVFSDVPGGNYFPVIIYNAGLKRYLLTDCHGAAGTLGIFEGPEPWGPWRTVYYEDHWGGMTRGDYLGFEFPNKWSSPDGTTLGMVFSVYDADRPEWNDACNVMQVSLRLAGP